MPAGQTPHTVTLLAHGDMVERVQPGDRVAVTGIYRAVPARVNPRMRNVNSVYRTSIDVLHFRKTDQSRLHQIDDGYVIIFQKYQEKSRVLKLQVHNSVIIYHLSEGLKNFLNRCHLNTVFLNLFSELI